jgi:hypothetical protein
LYDYEAYESNAKPRWSVHFYVPGQVGFGYIYQYVAGVGESLRAWEFAAAHLADDLVKNHETELLPNIRFTVTDLQSGMVMRGWNAIMAHVMADFIPNLVAKKKVADA